MPFPLLADPDHTLAEALGVWGEQTYAGTTYVGIRRTTYVIGGDGRVQDVYPEVKPEENAPAILQDLGIEPHPAA